MMRFGLRQLLAEESDLVVCGEAVNGKDALAAVARFKPDLMLLDITLPGPSGLDLLKDLRESYPNLRVLIHSMHDEAIFAERALRAGAHGYLMKQEAGDEIVAAIRQVLRGEIYLGKTLRLPTGRSSARKKPGLTTTPIGTLTNRELEIFRLIGCGNINKEIARQLHLSLRTIEAHREHIKRKLNLASSTALNLMAVRWENQQVAV